MSGRSRTASLRRRCGPWRRGRSRTQQYLVPSCAELRELDSCGLQIGSDVQRRIEDSLGPELVRETHRAAEHSAERDLHRRKDYQRQFLRKSPGRGRLRTSSPKTIEVGSFCMTILSRERVSGFSRLSRTFNQRTHWSADRMAWYMLQGGRGQLLFGC